MHSGIRKYIIIAAWFAALILSFRFLLPLLLPFLLGSALALAAEPVVQLLCSKLRLKRALAAGIGVSVAFSFLVLLVMVLCAFLLRQLQQLAGALPELEGTLRAGMDTANHWLTGLAVKVPGEIGNLLTRNVNSLFTGGSALLDRITAFFLHLASGFLSHVPNGALGFVTGIISSFMISAKLPGIRNWLRQRFPLSQLQPLLTVAKKLKATLSGWLKAQMKLSLVTFSLMLTGFLLLRVSFGPIWAILVALVDAFPILGTGTILVPWSLISFLQGDRTLAFGLLGLYAAAAVVRSVLEPRFLGKQLGLDPLITLMALYAGYRLWGIGGMIAAPVLAVAATQLVTATDIGNQFPS